MRQLPSREPGALPRNDRETAGAGGDVEASELLVRRPPCDDEDKRGLRPGGNFCGPPNRTSGRSPPLWHELQMGPDFPEAPVRPVEFAHAEWGISPATTVTITAMRRKPLKVARFGDIPLVEHRVRVQSTGLLS